MRKTTRRQFLQGSSAATLGLALPAIVPARALGLGGFQAASERIRIGMIGVGNQGMGNLKAFMKNVVAVCDVDKTRVAAAKEAVEKANGGECTPYADYRKLLESKEIDAVVITTPDHWHALMTVDACRAGKDVYCEKPLTLAVAEGRAMVNAARAHKRIVQTGSQQRSDRKFRLACEMVRAGLLGNIKTVEVGIPGVNWTPPPVPDSAPPADLDYDFWLGPAPQKPYNAKHVHYNFRVYWDYSGGQMTNFGAHHLDITQWALGMDEAGPVSAEGKARYHKEGWYEAPEWVDVTYVYPNGVVVKCGNDYKGGVTFRGEKGDLFVTRGKLEATGVAIPEVEPEPHLYVSENHHANWLECIKSRKTPICDVETGHRSATVCHLGNIAVRAGRRIAWDPIKEEIKGDSDAARMLLRPYRSPWRLPEKG
jgi:predicted dehydrogenase